MVAGYSGLLHGLRRMRQGLSARMPGNGGLGVFHTRQPRAMRQRRRLRGSLPGRSAPNGLGEDDRKPTRGSLVRAAGFGSDSI